MAKSPANGDGHMCYSRNRNPQTKGDYPDMQMEEKDPRESLEQKNEKESTRSQTPDPAILEEITIEELAVDGICGIY
jgi:mycofactocin precursor